MAVSTAGDIYNTLGMWETPTRPSLSLETELMLAEGCQGQRVSHAQTKALLQGLGCEVGDAGGGVKGSSHCSVKTGSP